MKESLRCLMDDFFNQLQATSNASFIRIFFNQLERQATIFDKQDQNLRTKRVPNHWKLDNNLSPRVGDFAQKIIPDLSCPGGPSGIHPILP